VGRAPFFLDIDFLCLDLDLLMLDVEMEMVVDAHVLIGNPYEGEEGNQVSAPVAIKKPEAGENQK